MSEDKPKYITNAEAYLKIASAVGINEWAVKNVIKYFFNFAFIYMQMQKSIRIKNFGAFKKAPRSKYLINRRKRLRKLKKKKEVNTVIRYNKNSFSKL
jgi:nucleoid DNA-binding protein